MTLALTINIKELTILHSSGQPLNPIARVKGASNLVDAPARRVRIDASGEQISPDDKATPHVAVLDEATGLMWAVNSIGKDGSTTDGMSQSDCEKACAALDLLGHRDWRLPTRSELAGLVDDTRHEPAIDTALFPGVVPRWHWTSTPAAWSAASAWYVNFNDGYVGYYHRDYNGFALAVRRPGQ